MCLHGHTDTLQPDLAMVSPLSQNIAKSYDRRSHVYTTSQQRSLCSIMLPLRLTMRANHPWRFRPRSRHATCFLTQVVSSLSRRFALCVPYKLFQDGQNVWRMIFNKGACFKRVSSHHYCSRPLSTTSCLSATSTLRQTSIERFGYSVIIPMHRNSDSMWEKRGKVQESLMTP